MVQIYIEHKEITPVLKISPVSYNIHIPIFFKAGDTFSKAIISVYLISNFRNVRRRKNHPAGDHSWGTTFLKAAWLSSAMDLFVLNLYVWGPRKIQGQRFFPQQNLFNLHLKVRVQVSGTKEKDLKKKDPIPTFHSDIICIHGKTHGPWIAKGFW